MKLQQTTTSNITHNTKAEVLWEISFVSTIILSLLLLAVNL
jgi:hypothetical protein